jgi:uncharacterized protein
MNKPLKILALADLHDRAEMLDRLKTIDSDLIVFCGDLHNGSSRRAAVPVAVALADLGRPVLIVPGNMDHKEVVPDLWRDFGFINLHCTAFLQGDCGFVGMGGIVARNPSRLGDPSRYYHQDEEAYSALMDAYRKISDKRFKIAVTHQPPRETRDLLYNGENSGSIGLRRFVEECQPDLLLCGHIHEDRGEARVGITRIINVGELRQGFGALIELKDEIMVEWIGT